MKLARKRLTYANVMSSIAVFLVLAGGTAFAAAQLGKNSVGTKQLKKNAVTAAKIKKNAITGVKIKNDAVNGAKIADGSITGTEIAAGTTAFSQIVARLRAPGTLALDSETPTPIGSYVQPPGETDQWVPGADVTWAAGCTAPREAEAYLVYNPINPNEPEKSEVVAFGYVYDETGATATKRMSFSTDGGQLASLAPAAALSHAFYLYGGGVSCETGDGASAGNIGIDVIGTK